MYRKIMSFLEAWKDSEHRKPLILQGARQVGKTETIRKFAKENYKNLVETLYLIFDYPYKYYTFKHFEV